MHTQKRLESWPAQQGGSVRTGVNEGPPRVAVCSYLQPGRFGYQALHVRGWREESSDAWSMGASKSMWAA